MSTDINFYIDKNYSKHLSVTILMDYEEINNILRDLLFYP